MRFFEGPRIGIRLDSQAILPPHFGFSVTCQRFCDFLPAENGQCIPHEINTPFRKDTGQTDPARVPVNLIISASR